MKVALLLAAFAISGVASAQSTQEACNGIGALGRTLATERDRGITLEEQLRRNEAAVDGNRDGPGMKQLLDSVTRTVHGAMKKVTPEDTYWRLRTMCLTDRK